jgi:hypothetical protein
MNYNNRSVAVEPGTPVVIAKVRPNASIGVTPGAGGSMLVQYRIHPNGGLYDWPLGSVSYPESVSTGSPYFQVVVTATTEAGTVDWNWLETEQRPR